MRLILVKLINILLLTLFSDDATAIVDLDVHNNEAITNRYFEKHYG